MKVTKRQLPKLSLSLLILITLSITACNSSNDTNNSLTTEKENNWTTNQRITSLGDQLFHDEMLSRDGNQSCSTCHNSNMPLLMIVLMRPASMTQQPAQSLLGKTQRHWVIETLPQPAMLLLFLTFTLIAMKVFLKADSF